MISLTHTSRRLPQQDAQHHDCSRSGRYQRRAALRDSRWQAQVAREDEEEQAGSVTLIGAWSYRQQTRMTRANVRIPGRSFLPKRTILRNGQGSPGLWLCG